MRRRAAPSQRKAPVCQSLLNIENNEVTSTQDDDDDDIPSTASIVELMQMRRKPAPVIVKSTNSITAASSTQQPATATTSDSAESSVRYFSAVWAKQSTRKHKVWTDDGFVEIRGRCGLLKDLSGKHLGTTHLRADSLLHLESGSRLSMGSNEAELVDALKSRPEYQKAAADKDGESDSDEERRFGSHLNVNMLVDTDELVAVSKKKRKS